MDEFSLSNSRTGTWFFWAARRTLSLDDLRRAARSAARTPRRRGTTPTIDDYYAKYSRSTAERLYDHDNATRRTFDEAARHAEALFAAHDMSPARD